MQQPMQPMQPPAGGMVPAGQGGVTANPFSHPWYTIKRPFWSLLGRKFNVFDPSGQQVLFLKHPLMKLRQEFTMYTDPSERVPLLTVKARQLIGFNICNDVFDARTGERVGVIRSKGLKSIFRDTWEILDPNDQPVGKVEEEGAAFLRRLFPILTGKWKIELGGQEVGKIKQVFRFFTKEFTLDISMGQGKIDPRFALACAMLALMAESRRESGG